MSIPKKKLTAITLNGRTKFFWISYDADGRARVDFEWLCEQFNIGRGCCVCIG